MRSWLNFIGVCPTCRVVAAGRFGSPRGRYREQIFILLRCRQSRPPGPCVAGTDCANLPHRQPDRVEPIPTTELAKSKRKAPRSPRRPRKVASSQTGAFTPLTTERLTLRPLHPNDAEALHRLVNDWEVTRTLAELPYPYPRELADEWIDATIRRIAEGTGYHLAITGHEGERETLVG